MNIRWQSFINRADKNICSICLNFKIYREAGMIAYLIKLILQMILKPFNYQEYDEKKFFYPNIANSFCFYCISSIKTPHRCQL